VEGETMIDTLRTLIGSWPWWIRLIVTAIVSAPLGYLIGSLIARGVGALLGSSFNVTRPRKSPPIAS
jgi:hypothetical protein